MLMVSPHFPPDSSAASHRVRLLAPYLGEHGWEPTVVTVEPGDYEARMDDGLLAMVPESLNIVRVRAWSTGWTRYLGFGDLGMRAFHALLHKCRELSGKVHYDCFFVTIFPSYPALLGPLLKRNPGLPFVLDYQDPWVGAWGLTAGPKADGTPDLKSRASRWIATTLEPYAVRAADAITAVSEATYREVQQRNAVAMATPCAEIPLGGEPSDFEHLRASSRKNPFFEKDVDEENLRFEVCGHGECQTDIHSAGVAFHWGVDESVESGERENLFELSIDFRFPHSEKRAVQINVIASRQVGVKAGADLEQARDSSAELDASGGGSRYPRQDLEECALAGAVVPDDAEHFTGCDVEVDVLKCPKSFLFAGWLDAHRTETLPRRPQEIVERFTEVTAFSGCATHAVSLG